MSPRRSKFKVPIYDAEVIIVVATDLSKEFPKWEKLFGSEPVGECKAFCIPSGGESFGLFFDKKFLDLNVAAHEVFHLTHSIMQWANVKFTVNNDEAGALLMGFLMEQVCKKLKM